MISLTEGAKTCPSQRGMGHHDDTFLVVLVTVGKQVRGKSQVRRTCRRQRFFRGDKLRRKREIRSGKSPPVPPLRGNFTPETIWKVEALLVVDTRKAEGNGLISM